MPARPDRNRSPRLLTSPVGLIVAVCSASCATSEPGTWNATFENDIFARQDSSYTNGLALSWVSSAVPEADEGLGSLVKVASFLPGIGGSGRRHHVGFQLSQSMFTPVDIEASDPPLTDRPYAGVLAFDTSVYAADDESLHEWTLKLGVVGPASLAGNAQRLTHEWVGGDNPKGWSHQLHDEPIANLGYDYRRRFLEGTVGRLTWDLTSHIGGAAGNYATFASTGAMLRLGRSLPENFGTSSLRASTSSNAIVLLPFEEDFGWHLVCGLDGFAIDRFLPQDGNNWKDSRSVRTEDFVGSLTVGFGIQWHNALLTFSFHRFSKTFVGQQDRFEYGSITMTWMPRR